VPAVQDAITDYCVLPQPPLDAALFAGCSNVMLAPNPCLLRVDGGALTLGVCSADIVKHVAGQFVTSAPSKDRMKCICEAIIGQRSFYPLHPTDPSIGIEYSQLNKLQFHSFTPDLLVLPSQLDVFVHRIAVSTTAGTAPSASPSSPPPTALYLNPGIIAKGKFCKLAVTPAATTADVESWKL